MINKCKYCYRDFDGMRKKSYCNKSCYRRYNQKKGECGFNYVRKVLDKKNNTLENKSQLITCLECKRNMKRITNTHLNACCNLSMQEYANKYDVHKSELLWLPERINHSQKMLGEGNPSYGIKFSESRRENIRKSLVGKHFPRRSVSRKIRKETYGYLQSEEARERQSVSLKKRFREDKKWSNKRRIQISKNVRNHWADEEKREKHLKRLFESFKLTPNKPETILMGIIRDNNLPFNFVGDGKIWFRGEDNSFNPDFLSKNPKHIIEVYGDYWHNLKEVKMRDQKRLETYSKYGYKTLIIWENELSDKIKVLERIRDFLNNSYLIT